MGKIREASTSGKTLPSQEQESVLDLSVLSSQLLAEPEVLLRRGDRESHLVAAGGRIANVGVHGKPVSLHLENLWAHNITITTRLVDTVTTPMLLKTVQSKKLDSKQLITHHFKLSEIIRAYDTFQHAEKEKALKVILSNE